MEAEWRVARARLRDLLREQPGISHGEAAKHIGYSVSWVRKWRKRIGQAEDEEAAITSLSRRPKHSPKRISEAAEERIIGLRTGLAEIYHRTVGPRTISAYLRLLQGQQPALLISPTTIWRVLRRRQYILRPPSMKRVPFVRPPAGLHWELDFCTIAGQTVDAPGKAQNGLEALNVVDRGSSAVIESTSAANYDAEYTLMAVARIFAAQGVPRSLTFDRDPRLVGSAAADGFPSAFMRFLWGVGCEPDVLPPHKPQLKPFVERFQRSLKEECISHERPDTAAAANQVLPVYCHWYNFNRPHQGADLHSEPPGQHLPHPSIRSLLPQVVDPDAWLLHYSGRYFRRHVDSRGAVQLWKYDYYIGQAYRGQRCALRLDAFSKSLHVEVNGKFIKDIPLKGLYGVLMPYDEYLGLMIDEARSDWKNYLWRQSMTHTKAG
jgi:transposase InsO family protein